ncbi:MAG: ECF-type sigma factor [Marinicellaceae bacterium]
MMLEDLDSLLPDLYNDLKRIARIQRNRVYSKNNLGTRSIVHEAYLNIVKNKTTIQNKNQLLFLTSNVMRNIIIDNSRAWQAKKRGGKFHDIAIDQISLVSAQRSDEIIALDEALDELKESNPRMVDVVTCLFFGGLTQEETSLALNVSLATIKRDWALSKALLFQRLKT